MIATTMSPALALGLVHHGAVAGGLVDRVRAFHRRAARLLVHELTAPELRLDDVDLLDVLEPRRPGAGAQTHDAPDDFG